MADTKLSLETNQVTTFAGTERVRVVENMATVPETGYMTLTQFGFLEIPMPVGAFRMHSGAVLDTQLFTQIIVFRDANTDVVDYSRSVPIGFGAGTVTIDTWWVAASGAGNIRVQYELRSIVHGVALNTGAANVAHTIALTTNVLKASINITLNAIDGQAFTLRIYRSGSDGADTLAANAWLAAVKIRKV